MLWVCAGAFENIIAQIFKVAIRAAEINYEAVEEDEDVKREGAKGAKFFKVFFAICVALR
jgi:hypothetical protein